MTSSSVLICVTFFMFCSSLLYSRKISEKHHLVQQECTHASTLFKGLNSDRCVQLLSTDPKSSKATALKQLAVIGLQLGVSSASKTLDQIKDVDGSDDLKSVLKAVASQVTLVYDSFKSALAEVQQDEDFQTANYDCFVLNDYINRAQDMLKKTKENVEVYQKSIHTLSELGHINYVITNDADD